MKKYLSALFVAVIFLGFSSVAHADISTGLQGWWKLDEGSGTAATDSSGNSNDATLMGSPSFVAGEIGSNAISLNGTSQYIQLPSTIGNSYPGGGNSYALTFSTWFKTTTGGVLFAQDDTNVPPSSSGGYVPAVYVNPSNGKIYASMFWHGSTSFQIISAATYNDGNWHQVVDTYGSGVETLYVDGTQIGTQSQTEVGYSGAYKYFAGTGYSSGWPGLNGQWAYFNGSLDDVRVYSRALSSSDVTELHNYTGDLMVGGGFSNPAPQTSSSALNGWAWSSNLGWISFSSSTPNSGGGDYSVKINSNGDLYDYAWSSNVGWVSFNYSDLTASPACNGTVQPHVDFTTGSVSGWARVISEIGRNDGWDGCIQLSDSQYFPTGHTDGTAGVTFNPTTGVFNGYAWGGVGAGWISFAPNIGVSGPPTNPVTCPIPCNGSSNPTLTFQVNSNGFWGSSATITADSSGHASAVVQWIPENISGSIQTASADWGETLGSTVSPSGKVFASSGTDTVNWTGITTTVTKTLTLSYPGSGGITKNSSVTITINPQTAPPQNRQCTTPAHSQICGGSTTDNSDGASLHTYNLGSCPASGLSCQFECLVGYKSNGTSCIKSSENEF